MKSLCVGLLVVAVLAGSAWVYVIGPMFETGMKPPKPLTAVQKNPVPKPPQPDSSEQSKKGPLSFWAGDVIVGEGTHAGEIELVGEKAESVVLKADKDGVCNLDVIPGMKSGPGSIAIKLLGKGKAPLITYSIPGASESHLLWPLLEASEAVRQHKLTPLIRPDIISPVERVYRKKGQILEGFVWSIHSADVQKWGSGARETVTREQYGNCDVDVKE